MLNKTEKIMKRNILLLILFALPVFMLQSCLKDQSDTFNESAAVRMQNAIKTYRAALTDASSGWSLDYWPEGNQKYGGYNYTIKFDGQNADVAWEQNPTAVTSLYDIISDDGPVLTFNTYNDNMHAFSTPWGSSGGYQAYQGDYEFVIMGIQDDGSIKLKGKKSGNIMYLRKLSETSDTYLANIKKMSTQFNTVPMAGLKSKIGGTDVLIDYDLDNQQLYFTYPDASGSGSTEVTASYRFTETGLSFYKPVTIAGKTFQNFKLSSTSTVNTLTCTDANATDVVLASYLPDDYLYYNDYIGTYKLQFYKELEKKNPIYVTVTLSEGEYNKTLLLKGLNPNITLTLNYSVGKGSLTLNSQPIGKNGSNVIWICAWHCGGTLTWDTAAGMISSWNKDKDNFVLTWKDNAMTTYNIDSYILWQLNSSGSSLGTYTNSAWNIVGTTETRLRMFTSMTKIK